MIRGQLCAMVKDNNMICGKIVDYHPVFKCIRIDSMPMKWMHLTSFDFILTGTVAEQIIQDTLESEVPMMGYYLDNELPEIMATPHG